FFWWEQPAERPALGDLPWAGLPWAVLRVCLVIERAMLPPLGAMALSIRMYYPHRKTVPAQSPPSAASAARTAASGTAPRPTTWPPTHANHPAPSGGVVGRNSITLAS